MLTQIDVMSDHPFELPILGITPKTSLMIHKVTGLNPPDRSLFIGDYSQDGGIYQGRRVGSRNVVMTINLNPNPALGETVSTLRQNLYKEFIDPQIEGDHLKVVLIDENDDERYFVGYCEKFETEIFEADTMCQISMICPDPYLRDNFDTILTQPTGYVQFPFTYHGTADTGFVVRIYVTQPTNEITLHNNGRVMQLETPTTATYQTDDLIIINTIRGQRSITLTKPAEYDLATEFTTPTPYAVGALVFYGPGVWEAVDPVLSNGTTIDMAPSHTTDYWNLVSTPIMSHLKPTSQWLGLHSSSNTMRVYEGNDWDSIVANIKYLKYTCAYWGI